MAVGAYGAALAATVAALGPPKDADRITFLKRAIAVGTINIDPARIADKMLAFGQWEEI
ncbi:MAG TPA: flagellar biosynthesis anti-sigma factor FlgM [Sphingorhabdus sp.]|nr:flagellar biosynthesis anti-sigma factor FlgM [Sphingorhabdus sp.]